jgi:hypothetical protein
MLAQQFNQELLEVVSLCQAADSGQQSLSDFPMANLDQMELEELSGIIEEIDGFDEVP